MEGVTGAAIWPLFSARPAHPPKIKKLIFSEVA